MQAEPKHPGRVLVVDDEKSVQVLLERVLTRAGHAVTVVASGEDALAALEREAYDLLIADKNLPGVDGIEVLRAAAQRHPRIAAIVITGFPTPETRREAEALGARAFVTKPFSIAEMLALCASALDR